jgi:hypothetical protein
MMKNEELEKVELNSEEFNNLTQEEKSEWYSLKLFNKNTKEIKYVLVTDFIHQSLLDEHLVRTGLYMWQNVFRGTVKNLQDIENINDFDIVQVNLSGQDMRLVGDVKSKLTNEKTKVVANNDYTSEMWSASFPHPSTVKREVADADMVFGTEYFQSTALSEIIGRTVYVIPHPCDVKRLKTLEKPEQKDIISTIWRRYDKHSYVPSLAVKNVGLRTHLIGYDKSQDAKVWMTTTLYDKVYQGTNYDDFCKQLAQSKIVYNPFTFHSYDRAGVDCAALGVALIGSNRTQSNVLCYPHTSVDPYDVKGARQLIKRLLTDEDFYKMVVETAKEKSEFYNHQNSKQRYLEALYNATKEKNK